MTKEHLIKDWSTDFDLTDARYIEDPYPIWDEMRRTCPVAHTTRFQGVYFPVRFQDVRDIAYDTEHFSSRQVIVRNNRIEPPPVVPPISSDPPDHLPARKPLLRPFSPKAVEKLTPMTRSLCNELIDGVVERGHGDAAIDYAQHIPTRVIAHMLGVPASDGVQFRTWIQQILEEGLHDSTKAVHGIAEVTAYFRDIVTKRRTQPGDDLVSHLLSTNHEGEPNSEEKLLGTLRLLMIAGIDTTWSAISASLWHLATHAMDRQRLVAEPDLMDTAVEEFLRAYAPVTMAREVVKAVEIGGCPMSPGNMVLLSFPAANRDPAMFADADKVLVDRKENRHAAFGLGIHRCIGSNLARMELRVAIEEWLKRIPEFELDSSATVIWSEGTVRGPRSVPVQFSRTR